MKNKLFTFFSLVILGFCFCFIQANAAILSESDLIQKTQQVQSLCDYDFISLINKSEMIGYRMESFQLATSQYQNTVRVTADKLRSLQSQINIIRMSSDFSDGDKQMQYNNVYQEADAALYNLNTKTIEYLTEQRRVMPFITYKRFVNKFQDLYNSLNLTNSSINFEQ